MKKLIAATLALLCVCAAINIYIARAQTSHAPADCSRTYVFGIHDGFVACYEQGADVPFLVTTRAVRDLTPLDRALLSEGVEVYGAREMSRTLEALTS